MLRRETDFDARLRIGLVGAGMMGGNHARVIAECAATELAVVVDSDAGRAEAIAGRHGARAATGLEALQGCDAVVVASSTSSHYAIATQLLEGGTPLLVEKPAALSRDEVHEMVQRAEQRGVPLMCGFVERFNAVVGHVMSTLEGRPVHLLATRHSPATPQATSSVVWDMLIHDVDAALRIAGELPDSVSGQAATIRGDVEIADCSLHFPSGMIATLSASRAGQRKLRNWQLATEDVLYDCDLLRSDVTVYRHVGAELSFGDRRYREQTVVEIPFVRHLGEPLALQLLHFVGLLNGGHDVDEERRGILAPHDVAAAIAAGAGR